MSKLISCIFVLAILSDFRNISGLRILGMFPFNVKSHSHMQQAIMKSLAARGHRVDVYTHFPLKKSIPNYHDVSLEGTLMLSVNNVTWDFCKNDVREDHLVSYLGYQQCDLMKLPMFQKLLKDPPKYDLVLVELAFVNCFLAFGKFLNAPMIGISSMSALTDWVHSYVGNPVNLATDVRLFSHSIAPMTFFERLANVVLFYYFTVSANSHFKTQNPYVEKYFGPGYPDVQEFNRDLSLILLNHNNAIHGNRAFAPAVVPVGGLHITDDNETLSEEVKNWMDGATSGFIYFTFGSMIRIETLPKNILAAFYETFRNIAPVKVLIKIVKVEDLPPGLPANVMTQPWFTQGQVLKHKNIKMFITHGGVFSTGEAVYHAVPVVGIPLFADETFEINNLVAKKTAILLDWRSLTRESFQSALTEILRNPTYKENAIELARRFKDQPMKPIDTAVFWVEYIARNGKDALKSPSVDLPWWQNSLLDVYGFILAMVLLTVYAIVKTLKFLFCCICFSKSQDEKLKKN